MASALESAIPSEYRSYLTQTNALGIPTDVPASVISLLPSSYQELASELGVIASTTGSAASTVASNSATTTATSAESTSSSDSLVSDDNLSTLEQIKKAYSSPKNCIHRCRIPAGVLILVGVIAIVMIIIFSRHCCCGTESRRRRQQNASSAGDDELFGAGPRQQTRADAIGLNTFHPTPPSYADDKKQGLGSHVESYPLSREVSPAKSATDFDAEDTDALIRARQDPIDFDNEVDEVTNPFEPNSSPIYRDNVGRTRAPHMPTSFSATNVQPRRLPNYSSQAAATPPPRYDGPGSFARGNGLRPIAPRASRPSRPNGATNFSSSRPPAGNAVSNYTSSAPLRGTMAQRPYQPRNSDLYRHPDDIRF